MLTRREFSVSLAALTGSSTALACPVPESNGVNHSVLMLNAACGDPDTPNVFAPMILRINSGDSVTFLATDKNHNTASKRGMIPEGAKPWNGSINEEKTIKFTVPGIYGYVCLPHYELGMVGLIVVDNDLSNLEKVRKVRHPGTARKVFRALLKELAPDA